MTQIQTIKILLGDSASLFSDEQISCLISQAEGDFKRYTKRDTIPTAAETLINDLVVIRCNRLGTEGLASQSFSGISDNFIDGLPKDKITQLNQFRKVKFL